MDHKLNEYKEKRNIEKSLEPEGVIGESGEVLRFVVQHHLASRDPMISVLNGEGFY